MNILYNTQQSGGTKDRFRWVKVPGTTPYWKAWIFYEWTSQYWTLLSHKHVYWFSCI